MASLKSQKSLSSADAAWQGKLDVTLRSACINGINMRYADTATRDEELTLPVVLFVHGQHCMQLHMRVSAGGRP